jgi:prepilin signal peptidase PulO-like enzyme (type II secretory pathway)
MDLTIASALGGLAGLLAGVQSRWLAGGRCGLDRFSVLLGLAGAVVAAHHPDRPTGPLGLLASTATLWLLLIVLASDVRERAVYPVLVYPGLLVATAAAPLLGRSSLDAVLGAVVCAALFGLCYVLAAHRYGRGALGDGDIAVAALLGSVVGLSELQRALLLVGAFGAL